MKKIEGVGFFSNPTPPYTQTNTFIFYNSSTKNKKQQIIILYQLNTQSQNLINQAF
jgi:hypothetical protein